MAIDQFTAHPLGNFAIPGDWSAGVPGSTQDAEIASGAIVESSVSETVKSIGVANNNALNIDGGLFEALNGTGPDSIASGGALDVFAATFEVGGGTLDNAGLIELNGSNAALVLPAGSVTLDGGGTIEAQIGGGPGSNIMESGNFNGSPTLTNQDNTISGDLTIGDGLFFVNNGTVETNNSSSSNAGTVAIYGTAGVYVSNSGDFTNNNTVRADNGGTIILGKDNITGSIDNEATIAIDSTGAATALKIAGNMTITGSGNGSIIMGGSGSANDEIVSDGKPATLTLVNQFIKGAGSIGDFDLTLDNQSGTIDAAGGALFLYNVGIGPTIQNGGTLEAITPGGTLFIEQNVNNTGTIASANHGLLFIDDNVSGPGTVNIGTNGEVSISNPGEVSSNIVFTGTDGFLQLNSDSPGGGLTGQIIGAAGTDMIDLTSTITPYSASNHLSWQQTNASGGVLSLLNSSNTVLASVNFAGTYTSANFEMSADGSSPPDQGTLITVLNSAPPPATTEVMIMNQTGTANYEIYDLGGNAIQSSGPLGQIPTALQLVQLGSFNGTDTADMLMRNTSTGEFWMYDVSGNNITNTTDLGPVGTSWQVLGFGDFSSNAGETDMLMRDSGTGHVEIYDIANGQFSGFHSMGTIATSWQTLGFGDFSGNAGESDMLVRDSNTGNVLLFDIANNTDTVYTMGVIGTSWQVLGFGDFSGHVGESDMLIRDSNTGDVLIFDITNNSDTVHSMGVIATSWQVLGIGDFSSNAGESDMLMRDSNTGDVLLFDITNNSDTVYSMGVIGASWQVAGFGDFSGNPGEDDMLMHNSSTGAFELYDIANSQFTNFVSLGPIGPQWSVTGIAADPPGSAPANAQLVQAMANYASSGGALDTTSPLSPTSTLPAAASLFATASGPTRPV